MEENNKREFRLYEYNCGTLRKVGRGKTGNRPHIFENFDECSNQVDLLRHKFKSYSNTQFIVIEYFGPFNSRIVEIL